MKMSSSIWKMAPPSSEARILREELKIPEAIAQILVNRNILEIDAARKFLFGKLTDFHDPYLMAGMKEAVLRIEKAIAAGEKILIFGDYDVDGVLSVVMLSKALQSLGADVEYYIPERLREGYGIKENHIQVVREKRARLVLSVDCGIKAVSFVKKAKEQGVDVIITDHHQPGQELPEALAILNPVLGDSGYPDKGLAGVGVVFKLIQALLEKKGRNSSLLHYTKLVAIGTIADVADLRGENRLFVKQGLKGLENVSNIGLKSLIERCGLRSRRVSEGDIGFRIGPRINAAGRMGMAEVAVHLFFADSAEESLRLVQHLEELNSKRQGTEERIYDQALKRVKNKSLDERYKLLILGCEEWHRGVIGIVASKLKDFLHRPVILFAYEDGKAYGSGRSISAFPLISCFDECKDLLLDYGGHTLAVGCVLLRENMEALKRAANSIADSQMTEDDLKRKIVIDTPMNFMDINFSFLEHFSLLLPFGAGNPRPLFMTEQVEVLNEPQLIQGKHIKFLAKESGRVFEALGWEKGDWSREIQKGDRLGLAYSLQFSEYLGEERLHLVIEDVRR